MKTERDKHAEQFANYVIEAMNRTGLKQAQIATRAKISRQLVSQIVNKRPHTLTGKLTLPAREIIDKIAKAFGDPVATARRAAGYSAEEEPIPEPRQDRRFEAAERAAKMVEGFLTLEPEKQEQILAILQILQNERPELLKSPVKIVRAEDLTHSDVEEDTG